MGLSSFLSPSGCTWVLSIYKISDGGYDEHYEYRCDRLSCLLDSLPAVNPEGKEPVKDWKLVLRNEKTKKDFTSILSFSIVYDKSRVHKVGNWIFSITGVDVVNEQFPIRLRYLWDKNSYEMLFDMKRKKQLPVFDCMFDVMDEVFGYSRKISSIFNQL